MRVIAGEYRGRPLKPVPGDATRPTTDRVKEAWASTVSLLLPEGFTGVRVLDAFAGSGALGVEALSRGAQAVSFFEWDRRAFEVLRTNTRFISPQTAVQLRKADVTRAFAGNSQLDCEQPYDLVILDPPYDTSVDKVAALTDNLIAHKLLHRESIISYEHRSGQSRLLPRLKLLKSKSYGSITLEYYGFCPETSGALQALSTERPSAAANQAKEEL